MTSEAEPREDAQAAQDHLEAERAEGMPAPEAEAPSVADRPGIPEPGVPLSEPDEEGEDLHDHAARPAIGIDIGGTGIKGAVVDLETGELLSKRRKIDTPEGGTPEDILDAVIQLAEKLRHHKSVRGTAAPLGICLPSIVRGGVTRSAANISPRWIGLDAAHFFGEALDQPVTIVNDADAAGLGEVRYGAAKGRKDSVLVTTLGTGIGSALIYGGRLFPNAELGHLDLPGHPDYEKYASAKVRERERLSFEAWGDRLTAYYRKLEALFSPDLFVLSGGISKQAEDFLHCIDIETPIVPAVLRNNAGIVGTAALAADELEDGVARR